MAILLQNLMARVPRLNDLGTITRLLVACDMVEDGMSDYTGEELLADWRRSGFSLETDAWVIVTNKGQLVGYADVWSCDYVQISMRIRVHPEYLGRGIGTLLLRLSEDRARGLVRKAPTGARVTLESAVSNVNQAAKDLLEQEGYTAIRHFWRMMINADESNDGFYTPAKARLDLRVNAENLVGIAQHQPRTGIYIARRFDIYEKELRAGENLQVNEDYLCSVEVSMR